MTDQERTGSLGAGGTRPIVSSPPLTSGTARPGSPVDRIAQLAVRTAARRWPADLAETMTREWQAELGTLRTDRTLGRWTKTWRTIAFAGSLALSPAVEEAGAEPITWSERAATMARPAAIAAGVTMVAAALFNVVHLVYQHTRPTAAAAIGVLAVATLLMVVPAHNGGPSAYAARKAAGTTALFGAALFGFLFAGNQVAVMPFMGWIDILPATATWTVLTALTVYATTRLIAAGRRRIAALVAVAAGLITLDLTAVAGSLHAAGVLGVGAGSAPTWFPLALLPGGTATFGRYFADGTATFGGLQASGPAFHASTILIGNASAMIGPFLLCTAYLLARAMGSRPARRTMTVNERLRIPLAAGGALVTLAAADLMHRSTATVDGTLHRMLENTTVFGFGFLAALPGRIAVALLAGLLIAHAVDKGRRAPHRPAA
jgi:hypothetical protein